MRNCEKTAEKRRCFFYGGCAVLYLYTTLPTGNSPALAHMASVAERLSAYTERTLLPRARKALDDAVTRGQGYRFCPHRVRISVERVPSDGGVRLILTFSLTVGEASAWTKELLTHWDQTEQIQFPHAPRLRRSRPARARRS